jgi:hypothetical protein
MQPWRLMESHHRNFNYLPFNPHELLGHDLAPCNVYQMRDKNPRKSISIKQQIDKEELKKMLLKLDNDLCLDINDRPTLVTAQQEALRNIVRKISIGDPWDNARLSCTFLTHHLSHVYQDPTDDQRLALQFQSARSIAAFLINHPTLHPKIYRYFTSVKYNYIFIQPLLSSIFTLGALKLAKIYSDKEIESLFLASYFKDIGMALLPPEQWNSPQLSAFEKNLVKQHPKFSVKILSGRIPLSSNYLKIIDSHHALVSPIVEDLSGDNSTISGNETAIISVMDIIAAMIAERPYRQATSIFNALDLIKAVIADQYPQEFRLLVTYFKNFFLK